MRLGGKYNLDDLRFTIYYMNFVTTRQSLSKLNFALAAPKFFDLFNYFIILAICHAAGGGMSLN